MSGLSRTKTRHRNFCFTLNNYTEEEVRIIKDIECKYLVFGFEVGESGTPHLQGYIMFEHPQLFSNMKSRLLRSHIEVAKGSATQNINYCIKEHLDKEIAGISWPPFFEKGVRPKVAESSGKFMDYLESLKLVNELEYFFH